MRKIAFAWLVMFIVLSFVFSREVIAAVEAPTDIEITPDSGDNLIKGGAANITWSSDNSSDVSYNIEIKYYDEDKKMKKTQTLDETDEQSIEVDELYDDESYKYLKVYVEAFDQDTQEEGYSKYYELYDEAEIKKEAEEADDYSVGKADGLAVGAKDGAASGKVDFNEGDPNNYLKSMMTDAQLIEKYGLGRELEKYREGFLDGYKSIYITEYKKAYREALSSELMESTGESDNGGYTSITMEGATVNSTDNVTSMVFEQGSVYLQNYIRIEKSDEKISKEDLKGRYIQVSNIYNVNLKNEEGYINVYKPIKMTFKYIGPNNAGVYKKTDIGWLYYSSIINGDSIEGTIDERTYIGGEYVVLIDKQDKGLADIDENWAKDEVILMAKRDWINGYEDGSFRPDDKITRAEFAVILYNIMGWYNYNIPDDVTLTFSDAYQLGTWGKKAVYEAVVKGIITGYPDGSFRPNRNITYQEVEWLVQRIYKDRGYANFAWEDMAQIMMDEKGVISRGITNKENYITRDEAAYMFYILNRGY